MFALIHNVFLILILHQSVYVYDYTICINQS